jgi:hypothetical protein
MPGCREDFAAIKAANDRIFEALEEGGGHH